MTRYLALTHRRQLQEILNSQDAKSAKRALDAFPLQARDLPMLLGVTAAACIREGHPEKAFEVLREALGQPQLLPEGRGEVAATLGWLLLDHYPDDPVPNEAREALATARANNPGCFDTLQLQSFFAMNDGEPGTALDSALAALRKVQKWNTVGRAQTLCLAAAAQQRLGRTDEALRLRTDSIELWPECDLLDWLDERLSR